MARPNTERDARIAAAARLGQGHEAIAREYKISRARVSQIVAAASPRSPEETQRQLIADRLRSRWDELEKIVRNPPVKTTSIGRTQFDVRSCTCPTRARTDRDHDEDCQVVPVLDMATVTAAIRTQLQVEAQFRQMFGVDLGTRPGTVLDEKHVIMLAEINVARIQAGQSPHSLPPPPSGPVKPLEVARAEMRADLDRRRAVIQGTVEDD